MLHHFGTRTDVCDGQERSLAAIALGASYFCGAFDIFCGEEETQGDEEQDDEDDEKDSDRGARYHCVWLDVCGCVAVACRLHEFGQGNGE